MSSCLSFGGEYGSKGKKDIMEVPEIIEVVRKGRYVLGRVRWQEGLIVLARLIGSRKKQPRIAGHLTLVKKTTR